MNKHLVSKGRLQAGFSLMEILIVLALIAAISGLVITNLDRIFGGSSEKVAKIWVKEIKTPLMAYRIQMGNYPSTEEGLQALIVAPTGKEKRWNGPYIDELPDDPWNKPYQYRYPGIKHPSSYDVWSYGPNGPDGKTEIGNWQD